MIYSLGWDDVLTVIVAAGILIGSACAFRNYLYERAMVRQQVAKNARLQSRSGSAVKDTLHGEVKNEPIIDTLSAVDTDGKDFFAKRSDAHDERFDREVQVQTQTQSRGMEQAAELDGWFTAQEIRRSKLLKISAQKFAQSMQGSENLAADPSVQQWAESSNTQLLTPSCDLERSVHSDTYREIKEIGESVTREGDELDYVVDNLETSVDFISMEFHEAVENWKIGKAHRTATLEDLKRRFRLKTFSLDDVWGLVFTYPDWISRKRRKLKKLVEHLGAAEILENETLGEMAARAEQNQWAKSLDIDMDLVFILREVGKSGKLLDSMTERLKHLERACSRRSGQIITPSWEGRSSQS